MIGEGRRSSNHLTALAGAATGNRQQTEQTAKAKRRVCPIAAFVARLNVAKASFFSPHHSLDATLREFTTFDRITRQEVFRPLSNARYSRHIAQVVIAEPKSLDNTTLGHIVLLLTLMLLGLLRDVR